MRLLHPLHNLRRHSTIAFEDARFAVCRASPFNDHDASASTTGHDLFGSPALLSEQHDDRPLLCAPPNVRPVESGWPRHNWFSSLRPRLTTSEHPPDHPAGSNPRLTGRTSTANVAHVKTALVMGTVALLALMAMACGSGDAPSSPAAEQPAAVAQVQQDQNDNQTKPSEPGASSATDTRDQEGNQRTGESTQGSDGTASEEPTDTPRPTPDNRPDATPTPQTTPTPTVAPTPTPDPMGPAFNLLRGYREDPNVIEFRDLYKYNMALLRSELSESLPDPVGQQHPDLLTYYSKKNLVTIIYNGLEITSLERVPSDGDQLQVKINFDLYLSTGREDFYHTGSATGAVDLVSPPYENVRFPQGKQLEAITDQVPVFSHVTGTPTLGPAQ